MARSLNISMPAAMRKFIDSRVRRGGKYSTPSEYIRDLVRQDEAKQARERIEKLLIEGLGGETTEMSEDDLRQIWESARERLAHQTPQRRKKST